jgi:uncharacterized DUF497 family protein
LTCVYVIDILSDVASNPEFDWDARNVAHLRRHRVNPREFEQVIFSDPFELEYQAENGEERYKALGMTVQGRILVVVWTPRGGRVRPVTAYPANKMLREVFLKHKGAV